MVARKLVVEHGSSSFDMEYNTDDGFEVLKFQIFSLTSIPPDQQKILGGDDNRMLADDSDIESVANKLRFTAVDENENAMELKISAPDFVKSDEELVRLLQLLVFNWAEEEALLMQFVTNENREQVEQRIQPYVSQALMYEDPRRQEAARNTVPVQKLEEKAMVALAREGNLNPEKDELDHAFLLQLLFWFKQSFSCKSCSRVTRFLRYNDPAKLLQTRKGRCGEWANCFTLYCRAFGYESWLILDFTDHVWAECFSTLPVCAMLLKLDERDKSEAKW